ncbi:hypothetical protein FACHB389_34095 [Nostoc calcicola FACHB-389]|nr:hypothetical protein FACHB389_34095 [Nostoc calcicola FACHB-389]
MRAGERGIGLAPPAPNMVQLRLKLLVKFNFFNEPLRTQRTQREERKKERKKGLTEPYCPCSQQELPLPFFGDYSAKILKS